MICVWGLSPILLAGGPWLEVSPAAPPPATCGSPYAVEFTVRRGTGAGHRWRLVGGALPEGLALEAGRIAGVPTRAGTSALALRVVDSGGFAAVVRTSIAVAARGAPPAIADPGTLRGEIGAPLAASVHASGGGGRMSWRITAGTLPPGLSLAAGGGPSATISGIPLAGASASIGIEAAEASGATAARTVEISIPDSKVIFVDPQLGSASTAAYDPAARAATGGKFEAHGTLRAATRAARPGTTVLLRGGSYREPLVPTESGAADAPIVYRAFGGEEAVIGGVPFDPVVDLSGRSHVVLDGLTVADVTGWLRAKGTRSCEVRNCRFLRATAPGSRAGLKFIDAEGNRVVENRIEDGNDNLLLLHSDRNLVEGNFFLKGRHCLWTVQCGDRNIVRDNFCSNPIQKIGQVLDCEGTPSDTPVLLDATKWNVIEANVLAETGNSGDHSPFAGIQHAAQGSIIRDNVFRDSTGPGLDLAWYAQEALHDRDNRVYANVFARIGNGGATVARQPIEGVHGIFAGNIFYRSVYRQTDFRWPWYAELDGKPVQVIVGREGGFRFLRNCFFAGPGARPLISCGSRDEDRNPPLRDLAGWQSARPDLFAENLEADPLFEDPAANDFALRPGSPAIDRGAFLTTATGAGSGTALPVADAGWFSDGSGLVGGDEVQLEGDAATARVLRADYAANILALDRPLSWRAGQGVARRYSGRAPDLGPWEFEEP